MQHQQEAALIKLAGLPPLYPQEPPLQTGSSDAAVKAFAAAGGHIGGVIPSSSPAVTNDAAPGSSSLRNNAATAADAAQSAGDAAAVPVSPLPNGYVRSGLPDTFRQAGPVLTAAQAGEQVRSDDG